MECIFYNKYTCLVLFYAVITEYLRPIYKEWRLILPIVESGKSNFEGSLLNRTYFMSQLAEGKNTESQDRANCLLEQPVLVRTNTLVIMLSIIMVIVTISSSIDPFLPILML